MPYLLLKRLARSLWRSKLRLVAVLLMVFVSVFAGVTFGGYAASIEPIYDVIYADDDGGTNLADLWIDTKTTWWSAEQTTAFCSRLVEGWPDSGPPLQGCEGRLVVHGTLIHGQGDDEANIGAIWHGIDPKARIDRLWFPAGHSQGRAPQEDDEVVIDAHVAEHLGIQLAQTVLLNAGNGRKAYRVVGIGYHPNHIYFVPEGAIFPPEPGTFVVGYLSAQGLARLLGEANEGRNQILLNVAGTPAFDLPDTPADEGAVLAPTKRFIADTLRAMQMSGRVRDRGENDAVEFMRQDLEGAKKMTVPFTLMIALIAAITLFLSMQRLVQSQSREIAILRTLGVSRRDLMGAYLIAPLWIGAIGGLLGSLAGPWGMHAMLDLYQSLIGVPVLQREVPVEIFFSVNLAVLVVVFLAGVWPAFKTSQIEPLAVLGGRGEVRVGSSFLQGLTGRLPTTIGLSLRSSLRKPMRLFMTFLAIGVSLMLFGSIQMMAKGMEASLLGGLEERQSWDVQLFVRSGAESNVLAWARSHAARAERLIELPMGKVESAAGHARHISLVALEQYGARSGLRPVRVATGDFPEPGRAPLHVMVDEGTLAMNGWRVGDERQVWLGATVVPIQLVGVTAGDLNRSLFFHREDLVRLSGVSATSVLLDLPDDVMLDPGTADQTSGIVERSALLEGMKKLLVQQSQMLRSMMGFGLLLAAIVMFNTLLMNLSERDRELATLRVLGASTARLALMLLLEALGIGLIGGLVGVLFAYGGAVGLAAAFSTWQFYFPIAVDPMVAVELVVAVVVLALLTTPLGVWRLRRMDLVEKAKELSGG